MFPYSMMLIWKTYHSHKILFAQPVFKKAGGFPLFKLSFYSYFTVTDHVR
jgi:hypothetical protein